MSQWKTIMPWAIRVLISGLFLLSAVAKCFPIWAFEKQLVDLGLVDWCTAPYLSRLIIALETAIAIAILQAHYLRRFVIPVTLTLLVAFCVHLGIQIYQHGAMNGNCGCFGQLIPMTPLEALLKNLATIVLLAVLYRRVEEKPAGENRFLVILFIYAVSALLMFLLFPFCPCRPENTAVTTTPVISVPPLPDTASSQPVSSVKADSAKDSVVRKNRKDSTTSVQSPVPAPVGPPRVRSKFAPYQQFSGKTVDLDSGRKIVCLFVPGCDHCRDAAKEIKALSRRMELPPVYVLFMNEEVFKIPEFFSETGTQFPYFVIDNIPAFFTLLGMQATTPGVCYLWNGNIIKYYEGVESRKFDPEDLRKSLLSNRYR